MPKCNVTSKLHLECYPKGSEDEYYDVEFLLTGVRTYEAATYYQPSENEIEWLTVDVEVQGNGTFRSYSLTEFFEQYNISRVYDFDVTTAQEFWNAYECMMCENSEDEEPSYPEYDPEDYE